MHTWTAAVGEGGGGKEEGGRGVMVHSFSPLSSTARTPLLVNENEGIVQRQLDNKDVREAIDAA